MKTIKNNKKQKGFSILSVILVIVAVIVAIGVWALSGQTNTNNTGSNTSDIQASSIINDSGAIKFAYDNLVINGSSPSSIVFVPNTASTSTAPNILDPTNGIQVPKVNANAVKASPNSYDGFWVYNKTGFTGNTLGTNATDVAVIISGVKNNVCQRINYILYGSTNIPSSSNFLVSGGATNGATASAPTSSATVDLSSVSGTTGWTIGCISTLSLGDENFFFRVLKVN